jgi:hypothetical protein
VEVIFHEAMKSFDDDYPLAAVRAALSNTAIAILVAALMSALAGGAVGVIAEWEWPRGNLETYWWLCAWAFHWGMAGVMLWGFPLILLHVWALYRLAVTESDPITPLLIILANQSVVSTISTIIIQSNDGVGMRRAAAGGVTILLFAICALRWDHKRRRPAVLDE